MIYKSLSFVLVQALSNVLGNFFSSSQRVIVKSLADFETRNFPTYIGPSKGPVKNISPGAYFGILRLFVTSGLVNL